MFDQTFVNVQAQTRRPWTVAVSAMLQTVLVATMLIVPLLHIPKLDLPAKIQLRVPVERVDIQARPEQVQQTATAPTNSVATRPVFQQPHIPVPAEVPTRIEPSSDAPVFTTSGSAVLTTGSALLPGMGPIAPAPPQLVRETAPPKATPPTQIHIGGDVQKGNLIFGPRPAYPRMAVMSRIQGTVHIQAIIERDGTIGHLKVLSGPPLLQSAALDAVKQWRYKPTLLNGEPVEVVTEIDVNFALSSQ